MIFTRRKSGIFAPDPGEPLILPEQSFGIGGYIVATLRRPKTGSVIKQWKFRNKIVNTYLDTLFTNTAAYPGVAVETDANNFFAAGTGTTAPAATNTALVAEITTGGRASTTSTGGYLAGPPDYNWITRHAVFSTAQANGTIGEFGWLDAASGGNMRARSVPKDTSGAATTIVKTSAATLTIDWSFYIFLIQNDIVINRTVGGTAYTITIRSIGANSTNPLFYILSRAPQWSGSGALGARTAGALVARTTSGNSGTQVNVASLDAYVSGSYTRTLTFTTQAMNAFSFLTNTGGTSSDTFSNIQMGFVPILVSGQPLKVRISITPI